MDIPRRISENPLLVALHLAQSIANGGPGVTGHWVTDTGSPSKPTKLSSVQWPRVRGNQVVRDEFNRPKWAEVKQKLEALDQADLSQFRAS